MGSCNSADGRSGARSAAARPNTSSCIGLSFAGRVRYGTGAVRVERSASGAAVVDSRGGRDAFDQVVLACHADEALALLEAPTEEERALLGAFRYSRNLAVLHTDESLMPSRRAVWSGWNYIGGDERTPNKVSRHLLDEPAAEPSDPNQSLRYAEPAHGPRGRAAFSAAKLTTIRCSTRRRSLRRDASGAAGGAERLVLRRAFRFGVPRGRAAGGPRGRRSSSAASGVRGRSRTSPARIWLEPRSAAAGSGAGRMTASSCLYFGAVFHRRLQPKPHQFRYRLFWLLDRSRRARSARPAA